MIVIAAGMPRAGSTWFFNMVNDLAIAGGFDDIRQLRRQHNLEDVVIDKDCRVEGLNRKRKLKQRKLIRLHRKGFSYAVKSHAAPYSFLKRLLEPDISSSAYIYRDPRDCIVSAMELGERQRTHYADGYYFAQFKTFEQTLEHMEISWIKIWEAWEQLGSTYMVRYEDLKQTPIAAITMVLEHLNIDLPRHTIDTIVMPYVESPETNTKDIHFNKGIVGRYKSVLSGEQISLANQRLEPYLKRMGYPLD
jgi:hypothetical protein